MNRIASRWVGTAWAVALGTCAFACGRGEGADAGRGALAVDVQASIGLTVLDLDLPATFTGIVTPSRDTVTLTLRSDARFLWREGGGARAARHDAGRWYLSHSGGSLKLVGADGVRRFRAARDRLDLTDAPRKGPRGSLRLARSTALDRFEDGLPMQGSFVYMADAALFTECRLALRLPVAQEGDYLALERSYLAARPEPGAPVLVDLRARLAHRPRMEGEGTQEVIVVDEFLGIASRQSCPALPPLGQLEDTYWRLVELDGRAVATTSLPEPHLVLVSQRLSGFTGCNHIGGGYELDDGSLRLSPLTSTLMACEDGEGLEIQFRRALPRVIRYELEEDRLLLYAGDSVLVARLGVGQRR